MAEVNTVGLTSAKGRSSAGLPSCRDKAMRDECSYGVVEPVSKLGEICIVKWTSVE